MKSRNLEKTNVEKIIWEEKREKLNKKKLTRLVYPKKKVKNRMNHKFTFYRPDKNNRIRNYFEKIAFVKLTII